MVNDKVSKALRFFKNKKFIENTIVNSVRMRNQIIFGARAINRQVPGVIRKPTEDFDIISKNPRQAAERLERLLDRKFKMDAFLTRRGVSKQVEVYKVISRPTERTVADFVKPKRFVPSKNIQGVKFATLQFHKEQIKRTLADPTQQFRHKKDRDALLRIEIAKKLEQRRNDLFPTLFGY